MPEDEVTENDLSIESQELEEAEAAFNEEAADEPDKKTETDEKVEETEKSDESTDDEKSDKTEETAESADDETSEAEEKGDEKEEQPADKTARERVEERLKDVPEEPEEDQEPEKKALPAAKAKATGRLTKEDVGFYLGHLTDDELPDGEIIIGDRTVNFKELREEEPEVYDGMKVIAGYMFDKSMNQLAKTGAIVTGKQLQDLQGKLTNAEQRIDDLNFWNEVAEIHPECRKLMKNKDFGDWIDGQSSKVKRLSKSLETPEDAIDLIGMYHEDIASSKAKEHDDKAGAKKKKVDDLHKHTMRQSKKVVGATPEGEINEEDEFAKEAERLEKESA